jgi:hypothetical protein
VIYKYLHLIYIFRETFNQLVTGFGFLLDMTALDTAVAHQLQKQLRQQMPFSHKAMTKVFDTVESTVGASHAVFLQDTGTVWLPKFAVARSWAERFECSFVEFVESAFFYYMVPLSAGQWFQKMYRKMAPGNVSLKDLMKPVKDLTLAERQLILPVKAACLLSGFGIVTIGGEYALNFIKNLMTEGFFKKSRFTDVINLNGNTASHKKGNKPQRTDVTEHAIKRIAQCWALCAAMLAGSAWMAKNGGKYPKLLNGLEELLGKQGFDFKYNEQSKRFGLSLPHFRAMLPIAVLGYIDAARDRLEFMETGLRASATAFFLGWGSPMLQNWAAKRYGHSMSGLMTKKGDVKTLQTLFADSIAHAQKTVPSGDTQALVNASKAYLLPRLTRKTQLYLLPISAGMMGVGLLVALMTQFWTRFRFKAIQQQERDFITRYTQANPQGVKQHWQSINHFRQNLSNSIN